MDFKIKRIKAREVLDSRGNPTIEVDFQAGSFFSQSIVPSGASTGIHEALELRDNNKKRYGGKGVLKAVSNVNNIIAKKMIGMDCTAQKDIDDELIGMDGTENKSKLGANAILGVSMAACKAGAMCKEIELYRHIGEVFGKGKNFLMPKPQMNVINGGKHAGVENDIQEHMIIPVGFSNFGESLRAGVETYHALKDRLKKKYGAKAILLGDEGGFAPSIATVDERLELLMKAISEAGYDGKIKLGLDCAASEFYNEGSGTYRILSKEYSAGELVDFYKSIAKKFPIISIEDGLSQDDWEGWSMITSQLGASMQIVGDDLLVTNTGRIEKALEEKSCNALLLKVNQIGTVSEAIGAANMAEKNRWNVVVSHRSGETEDSFISDLCVAICAAQCKFGAPARSERTAKYNRLLRIEEKTGF